MGPNPHLFLGFVNKIPKAYLVWKSDGDIQKGYTIVNNNKLLWLYGFLKQYLQVAQFLRMTMLSVLPKTRVQPYRLTFKCQKKI